MLNGLYRGLEFFRHPDSRLPGWIAFDAAEHLRELPLLLDNQRGCRGRAWPWLGPATHVFFGQIVLASRRRCPGQARTRSRLSEDPLYFEPGCLDRHIALQPDTVEISQLFHIVIAIGLVKKKN